MHFSTIISALALAASVSAQPATDLAHAKHPKYNFTVDITVYEGAGCTGKSLKFINHAECSTSPFLIASWRTFVPRKYRRVAQNYTLLGYGEDCSTPNRQGYYQIDIPTDSACHQGGTSDFGEQRSFNVIEGGSIG
ncbi:hypothetical protein FH972_022970 [Carpinus fangiana]|uniref:Uncharacterized protein n=1 Tax=Carpinus fangiana TaxID=176857 RepID=A0A5N6KTT2_9ROSI|nr:hypothetical protein FH972_022970 [Carpinus fangiana]